MKKLNIKFTTPAFKYCTDNAAMIAACAYWMVRSNKLDIE
jgi:tRNA A37 threonylcarbamoyltransferase TsaD